MPVSDPHCLTRRLRGYGNPWTHRPCTAPDKPLSVSTISARFEPLGANHARLGGSCSTPLAAFAELDGEQLRLRGVVGMPDGSRVVSDEISGATADAAALGRELAERLLACGADEILAAL